MEKEYDGYGCLRYEFFETLISAMLYKGMEKALFRMQILNVKRCWEKN